MADTRALGAPGGWRVTPFVGLDRLAAGRLDRLAAGRLDRLAAARPDGQSPPNGACHGTRAIDIPVARWPSGVFGWSDPPLNVRASG